MRGILQTIVPPTAFAAGCVGQLPDAMLSDWKLRPADGSTSVTTMFCASDGPALLMVTVYTVFEPTVSGSTLSILFTNRSSVGLLTAVVVDALLFVAPGEVGSTEDVVTSTLLVSVVPRVIVVGRTTMRTVRCAWLLIVPRSHVTVRLPAIVTVPIVGVTLQLPDDGVTETTYTFNGNTSVIVTLNA